MRVVVLLQARLNSQRLPGKVLREINGLPLLVHVWRRMLACHEADSVVVSASADPATMEAMYSLHTFGVSRVRYGPETDLLTRHRDNGAAFDADAIVRVTADCLFHDPAIIDQMIREYRKLYPRVDAVVNWSPRTWSEGCDAEVISMEALARMDRDTETPREGFATYMVESWKYRIWNENGLDMMRGQYQDGDAHLSIDTEDDVKRAEAMLKHMGSNDIWQYDRTMEAYHAVTR